MQRFTPWHVVTALASVSIYWWSSIYVITTRRIFTHFISHYLPRLPVSLMLFGTTFDITMIFITSQNSYLIPLSFGQFFYISITLLLVKLLSMLQEWPQDAAAVLSRWCAQWWVGDDNIITMIVADMVFSVDGLVCFQVILISYYQENAPRRQLSASMSPGRLSRAQLRQVPLSPGHFQRYRRALCFRHLISHRLLIWSFKAPMGSSLSRKPCFLATQHAEEVIFFTPARAI